MRGPATIARLRPAFAAVAVMAGAVLSAILAGPASGRSPPRPAAPDPLHELDIAVVRAGALTRYRVEGSRLVVRVPPDQIAVDRELVPDERARLLRAVRAVLDDVDTQFNCRGEETWISVTLDEQSNMNALCPGRPIRPGWGARWLVLLVVIEEIGGRRDLPTWGPYK